MLVANGLAAARFIDQLPRRGSGLSSVDLETPKDRRRRRIVRPFVPEPSRTGLSPHSRARSPCPELDCLRGRLPRRVLAAAGQRAVALGTGADRVLVTAGVIAEDDYVRALAGWLGVPFERLELPRATCPLRDEQFLDAEKLGLLPFCTGDTFVWVIAPQNLTARRLVTGAHPLPTDRIRLTSPQRLRQYVRRHGAEALGVRASESLRIARPELSAAACPPRVRAAWVAGMAAIISAGAAFHATASVLINAALALTFLAWTGLRLVGAATAWRAWRPLRMQPRDLPIYTIIVALYDEATIVPRLIAALRALDYPGEKLQIVLVLEPDDVSTPAALAKLELDPRFELLIAPDAGPRTKPRALNAALALARGTYTAVFDAEDRPAPDQLHRALDAFLGNGPEIACVQARLTIDNTNDSRLANGIMAQTPQEIRCA